MSILKKTHYKNEDIIPFGNMFIIGNGHIGYRGTLEEESKDDLVGLNLVGTYDKYLDKWRESLNLPNPFHIRCYIDEKLVSTEANKPINHEMNLDLKRAIFKRKTIFKDCIITSERFIPFKEVDELYLSYKVTTKKEMRVVVDLDLDIYEINGPHFKKKELRIERDTCYFKGITNEKKEVYESVSYSFSKKTTIINNAYVIDLKTNDKLTIYICARINNFAKNINKTIYTEEKRSHQTYFEKRMADSLPLIKGSSEAKFAIEYSIYQLNILGTPYHELSIPARGLSGQVYKGAIFWDTEIFMVPFFTLTNPLIARKLLKYRINTLAGALNKAKELGYDGAFYAWESQDDGSEACSKYNITDAITGKPIRTYFGEKQIHISSDIAYALIKYMEISGDTSILECGGLNVLEEVAKFNMSYAKLVDGKYHFLDVIGPDEYHERVDDNAYTTYMAYYTLTKTLDYCSDILKNKIKDFLNHIYLPKIENHFLEQFKGYLNLKESSIEEIRSKLRAPNEYWGIYAKDTKIIKQADTICLMVLLNDLFSNMDIKTNFDYYYPRTEHGSSLSSSMYSITASWINKSDIAYQMFLKTAKIDLEGSQKLFAGGIYIGGTHPAANAGAYLSLIFGMCGLNFKDGKINLNPHLPKEIKEISFKIIYQTKIYQISITNNDTQIMEV